MGAIVVSVHDSDFPTTVLAALGVVLALASLAWQAWSFVASGSRVKVYIRNGMSNGLAAMTVPSEVTPAALNMLQQQGFTEPIIAVQVRNLGRSPTSVTKVGVRYDNGAVFTLTNGRPGNADVPHRLDGESEKTWFFPANDIGAYAKGMNKMFSTPATSIQGLVDVGSREEPIVSQNSLSL
jgi:hypothetical protein